MTKYFWILFLILSHSLVAQTTPEAGLLEKTPQIFALTNAHIVVDPETTIESGTIIIKDRLITARGKDLPLPPTAQVIDLEGAYVYPGFIDLYTDYGIGEDSDKQTSDWRGDPGFEPRNLGAYHWNEAVQPQRQAALLFQQNTEKAKEFRQQGFTLVQSAQLDGVFQGQSILALLNDKEARTSIVMPQSAHFMSFRKGTSQQSYPMSLMGSIALIRQTLYDSQWYQQCQQVLQTTKQPPLETNYALAALDAVLQQKSPIVFACSDELDILRVAQIAKEFSLAVVYKGSGHEYKRIQAIADLGQPMILPVNFPKAPNVKTKADELEVNLATLKHWDMAPENPKYVWQKGVSFAFTSHGLEKRENFLQAVRKTVQRGLPKQEALRALTVAPAKIAQAQHLCGTIDQGKFANLVISDRDIFDSKAQIRSVWVAGKKFEISPAAPSLTGKWQLITPEVADFSLQIKDRQVTMQLGEEKITKELTLDDNLISVTFPAKFWKQQGSVRVSGRVYQDQAHGRAVFPSGEEFFWHAKRTSSSLEDSSSEQQQEEIKKQDSSASFAVTYPNKAFGLSAPPEQPQELLVKNATIWTCGPQGVIKGDLLVKQGKIARIAPNIAAKEGVLVLDAKGKHLTPGIVDEHSHIAISRGINEASFAVTSEVRIGDVINCNSIEIYRHLAGGVTTTHLLHGSANPIGGQLQVVKLRWGALPEEMKFHQAPATIKFALGENVKQSNWGDDYTVRYPQTRMGIQEIIKDRFQAAKEYQQRWQEYEQLSSEEKQKTFPPRHDLRLEILAKVLQKQCFIHCHSYVQSEILALARLANEYGFHVGTFTHVLEGYKVAKEIKETGAMASAFSDWWAYKFEVYEAIPHNGALMHQAGVVTSFNSDDAEMARRLNQEAAKAVKYGGLSEQEALKFVTLYSAKQLYVDHLVGSLKQGKHADFVLWSGPPLSNFSHVEQTWIEGRKYFDRQQDQKMRQEVEKQRQTLIQKILESSEEMSEENQTQEAEHYHCDDVYDAMKGNGE